MGGMVFYKKVRKEGNIFLHEKEEKKKNERKKHNE
jgi:hypothetical protein